ncbi:NAD kinase [Weissella diestrammenae]|uniref:NAD kinase n=1 Tax=Weissella diestrammenae TaxID=1162633 RepID=UPI00195F8987|nr:NAD kinase [Weissella diestrammenae]MCM0583483.1 NAD kinase [Weissella diestrammenae]
MKVSIYKNNSTKSQTIGNILSKLLSRYPDTFVFDDAKPDVVITVGGDGTLLSAFHHYVDQLDHTRFIGVHTGHLGFYADWQEFEIDHLVDSLLTYEGRTISYPLLEMTIQYTDGKKNNFLALNEAAIKQPEGTLVADVYLDGERFERFRGDGLTAATPTGSTAYNKANGGAVMHPSLASIQLSEIASINNRVFRTLGSPLVIGPDETIRVVPLNVDNGVTLTYDHLSQATTDIEWLEFRVAKEKIAFAEHRHTRFWHRVRDSFIGDEVID